jgi:hypothetical protein
MTMMVILTVRMNLIAQLMVTRTLVTIVENIKIQRILHHQLLLLLSREVLMEIEKEVGIEGTIKLRYRELEIKFLLGG